MASKDRNTVSSGQQPSFSLPPNQVSSPRSRRMPGLVLVAGLVLVGGVVLTHALLSGGPSDAQVVVGETLHTIQLDVLNGVGEPKLAQRMTDYLRSRGFDVVELGNVDETVEKTVVVDRSGNLRAAEQVAKVIGVAPEQVVQKIDKTLYLDVSVYIGGGYKSLHPYK